MTAFGRITGDPVSCQTYDWCWNISNNISFHFRLFQIWIFLEKRLCQFLNIPIIYHRTKNQKKRKCYSWGNAELTNGWTDSQKDGQTTMILWDSLWEEDPVIKAILSFPEFTSKQQKPVYSINLFVRYRQF